MNRINTLISLAVTGLSLIGAVTPAIAQTSAADTACMVAINNNYGGKVDQLTIVSSDFSQAGTVVMIDADGERWRCLASNDGQVEDLSVMAAAAVGRSNAENPAESACMAAVDRNFGGNASLAIISSDFSQAGTVVIIEANGERWRCLASNDGQVEDLSVQ